MEFWAWNHDSRIFIFHQIDFMPKMPGFYHFKIIIINIRYIIWYKYIIIIVINNIIFWLYNSIIKKPRYRNNAFTYGKYFHLKSCFWCYVVLNFPEVINGQTGLAYLHTDINLNYDFAEIKYKLRKWQILAHWF